MKTPCSNCPFRKKGGIRLTASRVREIANYFLDSQGATFPCHKSVDYRDDDDENNDARPMRSGEQMCVGGIIFGYKNHRANQMVRIAERTGFDPRPLEKSFPLVFDTLKDMLKTAIRGRR